MRKSWLYLLIGASLLAAAAVPLSILAFVFLPIIMEAMGPGPQSQPQGVKLFYEKDSP